MSQSVKRSYSIALVALSLGCGIANAGITSTVLWDDFDALPNGHLGGQAGYSSLIINDPFAQGGSFAIDPAFSSGSDVGAVFFNSGIGTEQIATINYGSLGGTGGGSMDFAALNAVAFEIDFLLVDQAFDFEVVIGGGGGIAFGVISVPAGMDYTASFTIADLIVSPNFDITAVDDVTFNLNLRDSVTASLDFATTEIRLVVPEPSAFALFTIGGFMMTRRRRMS